jgi:hypothetical protein
MDKEQTKAAIAVMQAYVDGADIISDAGVALTYPHWDWHGNVSTYRVKPDPKLRTWTPVEAAAHVGKKVRCLETNAVVGEIYSVFASGVRIRRPDGSITDPSYKVLARAFAVDGKPCGVIEETN